METSSISSSQYNDLSDFLDKHSSKKINNDLNDINDKNNKKITHTRIGDKDLKIYGASYCIEKEELPVFHRLYYEHVFVKNRKEYLTEKQLENDGPLLIDFDFRYDYNVKTRLHTQEHIQDIVQLYLEELKIIMDIKPNTPIPVFIMEKPNINRVTDKEITKDGIHMIFGVQMDRTLQIMLRQRILAQIGDVLDLPLKNDWDSVLDEGISKGCVNWQMYGSQKPGNEAYKLTYYLTAHLDEDNEWTTKGKSIKEVDLLTDFYLLSAQCDKHVKFDISETAKEEYEKLKLTVNKPKRASGKKGKVNLVLKEEEEQEGDIQLSDNTNHEILKKAVHNIISTLKTNEQSVKEAHEYAQILPEKYYKPGSHLINTQLGFALKRVDDRLFLSWIMVRSKACDFDFADIPNQYRRWKYDFNKSPDGVTKASIMYWAKQDAYDAYLKVKQGTIDQYIEDTIFEAGDWDYAMVLYHLFKDKYVCSSITNRTWYVFNKHRWEKDEGQRLRMAISKNLFELYSAKQSEYLSEAQHFEPNEEHHEKFQRKIKKIAEICIKLKKTNDKNNIMREAMEIFFDPDFSKNIDSNPYLLGFSNGVFDFRTKEFRDGYHQDYITKQTKVPYIPYQMTCPETQNQINAFMRQLFPQPELCRYMWDHLASTLIGIKKEQVFNVYRGSGSNGKSILTELMGLCLGDYKGTVPINLLTDKRSSIGGVTPEIMQLKGIRYAVGQEPSSGATINEGIMKELTSGDPLIGRGLWCDSEVFIPQFTLAVCTNSLFEIKSNDDGTWRRMKVVDFLSKFISEGEIHTDDTQYVFPKDKSLKEKLPVWGPAFMSMLIHRVCETDGEVKDCPEVVAASEKYRQSQDAISGFILDKIVKADNTYGVGQQVLNNAFKEWFQMNYGNRKVPKLSELMESMVKKFGSQNVKTKKWYNIKIREEEIHDDMNGENDDNI